MTKIPHLLNVKFQLVALLICYTPLLALSQTDCNLYINPGFESDCILTEYDKEDTALMEFDPGCMTACKGMTVQYDAICSNGSQFVWIILGASSYQLSNQNRTAQITWSNNDFGNIVVQATIADSITCTTETCVQLLEPPHVESQTIPNFYYDPISGEKCIDICLGTEIYLMDMSTSDETPIVGYFWETPYGNAYTPNYSIVPTQSGEFVINHKIINDCGCEDFEYIKVKVSDPVDLQLSCYGTVCGGTSATYTLLSPSCTEYRWGVTNGSISDGLYTPTITVQWDNPASGYGVISIDASPCETECNALLSVKIPIITDNATIEGPDVVCVGDVQIFELPAWGSTNYLWQVTPLGYIDVHDPERINQVMLEFSQPGIYTLSVQYECEFLDCGPYSSTKTIVVKDTLRIHTTDNTVCEGMAGTYTTNYGNNVNWRVYNQNGQLIHSTYTDTLYHTFAVRGQYKIEASQANFCNIATCFVTVRANPPAMDSVTGPSEACPYSSILLSGTPTQPNYYLEWIPSCQTASPQIGNTDSVTITYANEVCDVYVYQVDNEYGCHSSAYTHEVNVFALAPSGLPSDTTVCSGNTFSLSVPQQENVLYEWTITPANVATVMTNHLSHAVSFMANHLYSAPPHTAVVTLKRTCCTNVEVVETMVLHVTDVPTPTIAYSTPICQGDEASFTITSPISDPTHYTWQIEGSTIVGDSASHVFSQPGIQSFTMSYKPYANCPAVLIGAKVRVVASPLVLPYDDGQQHIAVTMYPNANYYWELDGTPVSSVPGEEYLCPNYGNGTYCCTISYNNTPYCSATGCMTLGDTPEDTCLILPLDVLSQNCTEIFLSLDNPYGGTVDWSIYPYYSGNYFNQQSDSSASAVFNLPGVYRVFAYMEMGSQCYKGLQLVDIECVPDFSLTYNCNNPVLFQDLSLRRTINSVVSKSLYIQETNQTIPITGQTQQIPNSYFVTGNNHITLTVNLINSQQCQLTKTFYVDTLPSIDSVFISQNMCENTPFMFSVITSGSIVKWDFGDDSYVYGNNLYHTYSVNNPYPNVIITVTNADGCVTSTNAMVTVYPNILETGNLTTNGPEICPGNALQIYFSIQSPQNIYYWEHSSIPSGSNTYNTYQTGDYFVLVVNTFNGCKKERMRNVRFLNAPIARITGHSEFCYNEVVKLVGNAGPSNSYTWNITGPESFADTMPNIRFLPTQAGSYNASLTVTNTEGCSATANYNFVVHAPVPAPAISFYGNQCIHTPPVGVHSVSNQNLFWSNGYNGTTAYYYAPGFLTAYYIDPTTGCHSEKSSLFIDPAPNYDALLTGCYEKCEKDLPLTLPVYKLYPYQPSNLYWHWLYNGNLLLSGNTLNFNLPINDFGTYFMKATYGNGCSSTSPLLTISKDDICDCDSITISVKKTCFVEDCRLFYTLLVTIHNNSSQMVTFDQLNANQNTSIVGVTSLPVSIAPYNSQTIVVKVEFADFQNGYVDFSLISTSENCEKTFSEFFKWQNCVNENCEIENIGNTFLEDMSTPYQTSCFKFSLALPNNTINLVALWSDPPQIINYYYNAPSIAVCMLMLNYGQLTQMVANGESICFYAILCVDEELCFAKICKEASGFYELIPEDFRNLNDTSMIDSTKSMHFIPKTESQLDGTPYLVPNPAQGEVTVMGVESESVEEIMILTMEGRQVAVFHNNYRFNISDFAKASYIVRIVTTNKKVHYLKLVRP